MKLPVLAEDKANHVIYGACVAGSAYAVARLGVQTPALVAYAAAVGAALIVGVGKEVVDARRPGLHTKDWRDAAATVVGGVAACLALLVGSL